MKTAVKDTKDAFFTNLINENVNDHKQLWKTISRILSKKKQANRPSYSNQRTLANGFTKYFACIGTNMQSQRRVAKKSLITHFPNHTNKFSCNTVSTKDVIRIVSSIPTYNAGGIDSICVRSLKPVIEIVAPSLAQLINLSLVTAEVPVVWKTAVISHIFKHGSKDTIAKYRPISLLPLLSKILEKAVCYQVMKYLEKNSLINKNVSGYQKLHSTTTALSKITDDILRNMERGLVTSLILTDLSKAFDTVDHNKLLVKLSKYGFDYHSVFWFKSYLSCRFQHVKVDGTLSKESYLQCDVLRGSVLGPVRFMIYLNDLPLALAGNTRPSPCPNHLHGYADDLHAHMQIQDDVHILIEWLTHNKLKASPDKFKYMLIGTAAMLKKIPEEFSKIELDNSILTRVEVAKNLGLVIDQNLKWDTHIKSMTNKCNGKLIQLAILRRCMNTKTFKNLVKVSYTSTLDYCDIVYGNACKKELQRVQRSQNCAARVVTKTRKYDSISLTISELGWLTMEKRRFVHRVNQIHTCLQGNASQYLTDTLTLTSNVHHYCAHQLNQLHVPSAKTNSMKRTFEYMGSADFNSLPALAQRTTNRNRFLAQGKSLF